MALINRGDIRLDFNSRKQTEQNVHNISVLVDDKDYGLPWIVYSPTVALWKGDDPFSISVMAEEVQQSET